MGSNTSFTVALTLTAINSMSSVLGRAGNDMKQYGQQVCSATAFVDKYDERIKAAQENIEKYDKMRSQGLQNIQGGMAMMAPVEETLRKAAQMEGVMKKVENALYDSSIPMAERQRQLKELTEQATRLGNVTVFSAEEAGQAQLSLIRNGMMYQDVLAGGADAAMYLAQTAEIAPAAAADAVSQITNMFQLQGSQLIGVADDLNRAANASSAGVVNLMHDLQQTGATANLLGLRVKETTLMLGVLHNMGLGDASGTYLNDMLVNLDKMTPKARLAMQNMGWLQGATVQKLRSGKIKVIGGSNSLFDEDGQIRSAEMLIQKLRQVLYSNAALKPKDMRDKAGNLLHQEQIEQLLKAKNKLDAMQQFKDVFGIQGMRAAIALATPGKGSYEEMVAQAERAQRIQEQVLNWQDTLLGKLETAKGAWDTMLTQTGTPFINEVGVTIGYVTKLIKAVGDFANAHPKLAAGILRVIALGAAARIGVGIWRVSFGWLGSILSGAGDLFVKATKGIVGFVKTFMYFRKGAGVFRSLWSAVAFGNPTLTRIIGIVGRFSSSLVRLGTQAILMGGRMALGWLIGLGPIGWIVLGVTALVVAAVAAWKTNFLGFRDFCLRILDKVMGVVNRVRKALDLPPIYLDILKNGSNAAALKESEYAKPAGMAALKQAEYPKPKVVKPDPPANDNRKNIFYIQSTDPKGAANEVSQRLGGNGMDKYVRSRDPRLQTE